MSRQSARRQDVDHAAQQCHVQQPFMPLGPKANCDISSRRPHCMTESRQLACREGQLQHSHLQHEGHACTPASTTKSTPQPAYMSMSRAASGNSMPSSGATWALVASKGRSSWARMVCKCNVMFGPGNMHTSLCRDLPETYVKDFQHQHYTTGKLWSSGPCRGQHDTAHFQAVPHLGHKGARHAHAHSLPLACLA